MNSFHITVANESDMMGLHTRTDIDGMILVDGEVFTYNYPFIGDLKGTHDEVIADYPSSRVTTYRKLGTMGWVCAYDTGAV